MTVDKDNAAASDDAQRSILRTQSGYITRLVGEKNELIDQVEVIQAERDAYKARAEAAEARIAPAVTRDDVDEAVKGTLDGWNITLPDNLFDAQIDAVWALVSGDDPAVFVVRESQIAAVEVERDSLGGWEVNGDLVAMRQNTAEALRGWSLGDLQMLARYEAVARAIEAEQATDPVEVKAEELMRVLAPETEDRTWGILTEPAREDFRRLARHILGQEADNV